MFPFHQTILLVVYEQDSWWRIPFPDRKDSKDLETYSPPPSNLRILILEEN